MRRNVRNITAIQVTKEVRGLFLTCKHRLESRIGGRVPSTLAVYQICQDWLIQDKKKEQPMALSAIPEGGQG